MEILKYFGDDKYIKDTVPLKAGLYVKVNKDLSLDWKYFSRNTTEEDACEELDWFRMRNFHSLVSASTKFIGASKLFSSNNLISFFFGERIFYDFKTHEFDMEMAKNRTLTFINTYLEKDLFDYSKEEVTYAKKVMLESVLNDVAKLVKQLRDNKELKELKFTSNPPNSKGENTVKVANECRIRVFFDEEVETFLNHSHCFKKKTLFNKNDFNIEIGDIVFGATNFSTNLSDKKPLLKHMDTIFKVGLISEEDALKYDKLSAWLIGQKLKNGFISLENTSNYLTIKDKLNENEQGVFISFSEEQKGIVIKDYYTCVGGKDINFNVNNFLMSRFFEEKTIGSFALEEEINKNFFNKCLIPHYFTKPGDIKVKKPLLTRQIKNNLLATRKPLFSFFRESKKRDIVSIVNKNFFNLIEYKVSLIRHINNNVKKSEYGLESISKTYNFYLSLVHYIEKEGETSMPNQFKNNYLEIRKKVTTLKEEKELKVPKEKQTEFNINNDIEFSVLVGQLVKYLLNQSVSNKLTYSVINVFIKNNNNETIINSLMNLVSKYRSTLNLRDNIFSTLLENVLSYEPTKEFNNKACLYGILADNCMYISIKNTPKTKLEDNEREDK